MASDTGPATAVATKEETKPRLESEAVAPEPQLSPTPSPRRYYASIFPGPNVAVDNQLVSLVKRLESTLEIPIWLMLQDGNVHDPFGDIDRDVFTGFRNRCKEIEDKKPVGLLIESPGGDAHLAYQIARLFQRRASQFTVIVPRCAKSAATLIALGATELIMGRDAEIGPLDVQMYDPEREESGSALNAVQSLERLNAFSMAAVDQLMPQLIRRAGKKVDTLLPLVLNYVVSFVKPLLEKIDAVDYTKKSRELKVAEQYAIRLMKSRYTWLKAKAVAGSLVEKFPTHGFVIDRDEATAYEDVGASGVSEKFGLGLSIKEGPPETENILSELVPVLDGLTVIGRLEEVSS
jgi:hypothetical protein